ncbi:MAG: hypothetical protein IJU25_06500 [Lachnospiraceae bacterium]|nr:hypothetical protein [Lachnospiraceae bacterium]
MGEINLRLFEKRTLSYLGDHKMEGALVLSDEIVSCLFELEQEAGFLAIFEKYAFDFDEAGSVHIGELDLTLPSKDLAVILAGCDQVCVIASTLGVSYERYGKRVMSMNMTHGVVLDAAASAYLECKTDDFTEELGLGIHTFRFAPGYGDLDLKYNIPLLTAMKADKRIGITHTGGGLFLPQKSMLGIVGIGMEQSSLKDRCEHCIRRENCDFRKAGTRCYG